jgi:hypothetical protein
MLDLLNRTFTPYLIKEHSLIKSELYNKTSNNPGDFTSLRESFGDSSSLKTNTDLTSLGGNNIDADQNNNEVNNNDGNNQINDHLAEINNNIIKPPILADVISDFRIFLHNLLYQVPVNKSYSFLTKLERVSLKEIFPESPDSSDDENSFEEINGAESGFQRNNKLKV